MCGILKTSKDHVVPLPLRTSVFDASSDVDFAKTFEKEQLTTPLPILKTWFGLYRYLNISFWCPTYWLVAVLCHLHSFALCNVQAFLLSCVWTVFWWLGHACPRSGGDALLQTAFALCVGCVVVVCRLCTYRVQVLLVFAAVLLF